jgi:hypothetical protein
LPFGIDPPFVSPPPAPDEAAWAAEVGRFVDKLADTSGGDSLPLIVVGDGGAGALPVALAAARRLTRRGRTALVDLGPSPAWLPDLFDRARAPTADLTLAALAADPSQIAEAAERDISTALDIFPSREAAGEDLRALWAALSRDYAFVVAHAPDWREPACARAVEDMAALLIAAPASQLAGVEAQVRAAFRDEGVAIKGIATSAQAEAQAA